MPSGGARARSGPAPDPNALRRDRKNDGKEWIVLPAAGRDGPTPEWPLARPTKRELQLWEREWKRPQAIMWDANGQELEVGMYVRAVRIAENSSAPAAARNLVARLMSELGISVGGLAKNMWRIDDVSPAEKAAPQQAGRSAAGSAKERLRMVKGGAAS